MNLFPTAEEANSKLDIFINSKIDKFLEDNLLPNYNYTSEDLHKNVNEEETLIEYIRDSEHNFALSEANVDVMTDLELNKYVMKLDLMWNYV